MRSAGYDRGALEGVWPDTAPAPAPAGDAAAYDPDALEGVWPSLPGSELGELSEPDRPQAGIASQEQLPRRHGYRPKLHSVTELPSLAHTPRFVAQRPSSRGADASELQRLRGPGSGSGGGGSGGGSSKRAAGRRQFYADAAVVGYLVTALGFIAVVVHTMYGHPIYPFRPESVPWMRAWLTVAAAGGYGGVLCFGGVVVASERSTCAAAGWLAACLLLGTPACCVWTVVRLCRHGTLALQCG